MQSDLFDESSSPKLLDSNGDFIKPHIVKSHHLKPLLTTSYNLHNLLRDEQLIPPLAFDKLLDAPVSTVMNLNVHPGDRWFMFWFSVSSFLPLISTCLGPLGNMISIIGLADTWRINNFHQKVDDPHGIRILNCLSLGFGLVGNGSLVVNFSNTKSYLISQSVLISCWVIASMLLLAGIIQLNTHHMDDRFTLSEGHWFSVFTVVIYMLCSGTMSLNIIGFWLGKYPPMLNLNRKEKALMWYTVCLSIWLVVGACVTKNLLSEVEYGSALYYCVVSVLTIGLGDITPSTSGAKAFILVFSLVGVILMGLVVAMIRQVLHNTNNPVVLWHRMERERQKCLDLIHRDKVRLKLGDGFKVMRNIEHKSKLEQELVSLFTSILMFLSFWLIGALVFHFVEGWSYFDAVYFCLLCLITIGYGDFSPNRSLGRVFFVVWAISAVPLMTILISNMGDTIFATRSVRELFDAWYSNFTHFFYGWGRHDLSDLNSIPSYASSDIDEFHESPSSPVQPGKTIEVKTQELTNILDLLNQLKPLIEDTLDTPSIEYEHRQWNKMVKQLQGEDHINSHYWLSDDSPLRLPLHEPNYFISSLFYKMETDLVRLLESEKFENGNTSTF